MVWLVLVGVATGQRTMTPIAVLSWFSYLGLVQETGWAFWTARLVSAIVFTIFALGEYYGDTLPQTPNRTAPGPLGARIVFGGLVGALAAHAVNNPIAGGVVFGVIGALIGAFGGMKIRMVLSRRLGRDLPVALGESFVALAIAVLALEQIHRAATAEATALAIRLMHR